MTTKDKINQALGISNGKNIDDMLNDLNIEADKFHQTFDNLDENINTEIKKIDEKALELQKSDSAGILTLYDMNSSLKAIEDIIQQSKLMFTHIVDNITSSDLLDSELVHSASALIESIHLNIAEFISIYKQKTKFVEKIKLMVFQQEQKKELMKLKHDYDMELLNKKISDSAGPVIEGEAQGYEFDTDKIIKNMSKAGAFQINFENDDPIKEVEENDEEDEDKDDDKVKK